MRAQFAAGMVLLIVIPALALWVMTHVGLFAEPADVVLLTPVFCLLVLAIALAGYVLLRQGPTAVAGLRKHLEQVIDKEFVGGRYLPFIKELYADMDKTRALLAGMVGASPEEIALTRSATEALNIVFWGLHWQPGDEVITVANTAVPTASAISMVGATPVFVDIDEHFLMDADRIEFAVSERTKAILPVHLYGHMADMDRIVGSFFFFANKRPFKVEAKYTFCFFILDVTN